MENLITIGLPSKGRLKDKSTEFFNSKGLKISSNDGDRNYFASIENRSNTKIIYLHAKEIIQRLGDGTLDVGISGLDLLKESEKKTQKNNKLQINLALNYGSKFELINAFNKLRKSKKILNEKNLKNYLQTKNIPDPDLLIRTGNTKRLSNFLLWQLAYSEIFFEKKLWPDFTEKDYNKVIKDFKRIKRNFGNI